MNDEASAADSQDDQVQDWIDQTDLARRCSAREIVELVRGQLGEVEERVDQGRATFSVNGDDVAAVEIDDQHISLFIPDRSAASELLDESPNVESTAEGVRFEQLTDINRQVSQDDRFFGSPNRTRILGSSAATNRQKRPGLSGFGPTTGPT